MEYNDSTGTEEGVLAYLITQRKNPVTIEDIRKATGFSEEEIIGVLDSLGRKQNISYSLNANSKKMQILIQNRQQDTLDSLLNQLESD